MSIELTLDGDVIGSTRLYKRIEFAQGVRPGVHSNYPKRHGL